MNKMNFNRRDFIKTTATLAATSSTIGSTSLFGDTTQKNSEPTESFEGVVLVNNKSHNPKQAIIANSTIQTKKNSKAIFKVGKDAFMVKENSKIITKGEGSTIDFIKVVGGQVLSVFGEGKKSIKTKTATIGIRGTGVYVDVTNKKGEPDNTYFCLCYGKVDITDNNGESMESNTNDHYHKAINISSTKMEKSHKVKKMKAGQKGHNSEELAYLEKLVGRKPIIPV